MYYLNFWKIVCNALVLLFSLPSELKPQSSLCEKAVTNSNCSTPINAKKKRKIYAVAIILVW